MSVLVKGIDMPKKGFLEILIYEDGTVQITGESIEYDGKFYYTPADNFGAIIGSAIEIPPHGRLIDADALKKKKKHSNEFAENVVSVAEIDWMPTVIEAEEET